MQQIQCLAVICLFQEVSDHLVRRYHFEKRHQEEDDDQANILNELKQDISGFNFEMFEALGEMDKKIRQVEAKVHDKDMIDDGTLGTGMFQVSPVAASLRKRQTIYELAALGATRWWSYKEPFTKGVYKEP